MGSQDLVQSTITLYNHLGCHQKLQSYLKFTTLYTGKLGEKQTNWCHSIYSNSWPFKLQSLLISMSYSYLPHIQRAEISRLIILLVVSYIGYPSCQTLVL
ncbi:hypothetical protein SORBI_3006G045601 [Sorghum bicolor]|uniref:Uncharacterized protein n=1 Tax=Sorghum bicolor TaxID=4558 RepID=A0A1Z5RC78_SORBI|nr:hypothetical protein SORBI_3006G045601 [Sorghum bicolor]